MCPLVSSNDFFSALTHCHPGQQQQQLFTLTPHDLQFEPYALIVRQTTISRQRWAGDWAITVVRQSCVS